MNLDDLTSGLMSPGDWWSPTAPARLRFCDGFICRTEAPSEVGLGYLGVSKVLAHQAKASLPYVTPPSPKCGL